MTRALAPKRRTSWTRSKKRKGDWPTYERQFMSLLHERAITHSLDQTAFEHRTALLCSEASPEKCHRRLVVEYLAESWPGVRAVHL